MKKTVSTLAMVFGFFAAAVAAICFQVSFFYLSEPEPVKFYVTIMKAEGKSFAAILLPLIAAIPVFAIVSVGLIWWAGREPGLKKPIRWTGIVLAVVWFVLCLNFLGYTRIFPESVLPAASGGQWVTTSSINLSMLIRMYLRMFRPGLGIAPIEQAFPWLLSIAAFPSLAFLFTINFRKLIKG
jgi:hypothetical protein